MKIILLIMIGISILNADFSRSATGVVTDSVTGLQWQDDVTLSYLTWQGAIDHCEALTLDGQSDWRLPNKNELLSIVDYSVYSPSINAVFQNIISNVYWSSTTGASNSSAAWFVGFDGGSMFSIDKFNNVYVRCVRLGQ